MAFQSIKRIIKGAPYRHTWVFRDNNGNVKSSPASPTVTFFAKDNCGGGTVPAAAPLVQDDTGGFMHYLDLTAAEMTADLIEAIITASSARAEYMNLKPEPNLHSGVLRAGAAGNVTLAANARAEADFYNGAMIELVRHTVDANSTMEGQIRTIVDYTAVGVATIDRAWETTPDGSTVYIIHPRTGIPTTQTGTTLAALADIKMINGDAVAAQMLEALYEGAFITSSVTNETTPSTTTFTGAVGLETTDDFYGGGGSGKNMLVLFTSGALKGLAREIIDYSTARLFTVEAFPTAPANGDKFIIIAVVQ